MTLAAATKQSDVIGKAGSPTLQQLERQILQVSHLNSISDQTKKKQSDRRQDDRSSMPRLKRKRRSVADNKARSVTTRSQRRTSSVVFSVDVEGEQEIVVAMGRHREIAASGAMFEDDDELQKDEIKWLESSKCNEVENLNSGHRHGFKVLL